jgi:hypothetical protein
MRPSFAGRVEFALGAATEAAPKYTVDRFREVFLPDFFAVFLATVFLPFAQRCQ